jgi:hypothetical protein
MEVNEMPGAGGVPNDSLLARMEADDHGATLGIALS